MKKSFFLFVGLVGLVISLAITFMVAYPGDKTLAGQVLDAYTGEPVPGAVVRLGLLTALTDSNGRFHFAGVSGQPRLAVEAEGYYPQVQPLAWTWWRTHGQADLRLQPTRLTGTVSDAWNAQPLAGVAVEAGPAASAPGSRSVAVTDTSGRFTLTHLAPPLVLSVATPGYLTWQAPITDHQSLAPYRDWRVKLTPNAITGTVRASDTGEALAHVAITCGEQVTHSDELGRFQLHRLMPGATVQLTPPAGFLPAQATYTGQGEFAPVVEPRRVVVTARDGWLGTPLPGTVVYAQAISRSVTADGAQFTRIAPGAQLQLVHEGYVTTQVTYQGETHLEVTLRPYALQGVVRDGETGRPVAGATLYTGDQFVDADEAGWYRIPELAGNLHISIKAPGFRKGILSLSAGTATLPSLDVAATPCAQAPPTPGPLCLDLSLTPFEVRGIYIPFGLLSRPDTVRELLDLIERTELNALVVDVKGDRGALAYTSQLPLAIELGVSGEREGWLTLGELLNEAKARNIYTIARIVTFKDHPLALGRLELAVQRADGTAWTDGEGLGWGNPFREEVWDYNIGIAREVAALGFDEIQFDYLRFPSDGDIGAIVYAEENTVETRTAAIREFTRRAREALRPYGVFTSADVFGLTVWVEPESDMSIGQRVMDIAPLVDYLCPMVYPSTFRRGNLGYQQPSAHPYEVIYRSQQAAEARVPPATRVRPWLQAYWYTLDEMRLQKQAAQDAGAPGWTFWNAGGVYAEALFEAAGEP